MGAERKTLRGQSGVRKCSGYRLSATFWVIFSFFLRILTTIHWFFEIRGIPRRPGFMWHTSVMYLSIFLNLPYLIFSFLKMLIFQLWCPVYLGFFSYNLRIFSNISHLFNHQGFYQTIKVFFLNYIYIFFTPNFISFLTGLFFSWKRWNSAWFLFKKLY